MKYYLGQINDRIGERELSTTVRFQIPEGAGYGPDDRLEDIASEWWGNDPDSTEEGYYFGGGEVCTTAGSLLEVSEETYKGVSILISDLS